MLFKTSCPECEASLTIPAASVGKTARCPRCRAKFVVNDVQTPSSDKSLTEGPQATETVTNEGPSTTVAAPTAGKTLGRFELRRVLGQGGFGRVYQAYDPQLERLIALKVPTFGTQDGKKAKRFQEEAKAAAQLRHPHIVPTFESGRIGNQFFIAAQFIEGQPLSDVINAGPVDFRDAAAWCAKIALALDYAHGMKIVHRDVKPQNIMLDDRGEPQLMDFGLAKRLDDDSGMTGDGTMLGTPAYMAPEQAKGDIKQIGPHTDQYALGVTLYELLTGRRPFVGEPLTVLHQIVHDEPKPPSSVIRTIPRDLDAITQKAMSKEIDRRYARCEQVAADLRNWLNGEPTLARPISSWERLTRWAKRNRTLATAFVVTAAAILLVAVLGISLATYQSYAKRQIEGEQQKTKRALKEVTIERDRAEEQTKIAEQRRQSEEKQRQLAETRLEEAQSNAYVANLRMAAAKWDSYDIVGTHVALEAARPKPGEKDRRGWEWNYLWNVSHSELYFPNMVNHVVSEASFSPDGLRLVACEHGEVVVRDFSNGTELFRFSGDHQCRTAVYSPDGKQLFVGMAGGSIVAIDSQSGRPDFTLDSPADITNLNPGNAYSITELHVTSDGKRLAAGSGDSALFVWDVTTRQMTQKYYHSAMVRKFTVLDGSQQIALSHNFSREIVVVDVDSGKPAMTLTGDAYPMAVCSSPNGNVIAAATSNGMIDLWDVAGQRRIKSFSTGDQILSEIQFHPDGERIACCGTNGIISVWNTLDERLLLQLPADSRSSFKHTLTFSPDGRWLVSSGSDWNLRVWDLRTGMGNQELRHGQSGELGFPQDVVEFDHMSNTLACARPDTLKIWNIDSGEAEKVLKGAWAQTLSCGAQMAVLWEEPKSQFTVIDLNGDQRLLSIECKIPNFYMFRGSFINAFSRDGKRIVSNSGAPAGSLFGVWDVKEGTRLKSLSGNIFSCMSASFSPDGALFAAGGNNRQVSVWHAATGDSAFHLDIGDTCRHLAFDSTGRLLAAVSTNYTWRAGDEAHDQGQAIHVWDIPSRSRKIYISRAHSEMIVSILFSPDNRRLFSVDANGTMKVWDATNGLEIVSFERKFGRVSFAQSNQSGTKIALATSEKVILLDGRLESEWQARATERVARSTLAWFREKTTNQDELVAAIQGDLTISEGARSLAVKFASRPPVKIVEFKP